jgi:hypothetical protein
MWSRASVLKCDKGIKVVPYLKKNPILDSIMTTFLKWHITSYATSV